MISIKVQDTQVLELYALCIPWYKMRNVRRDEDAYGVQGLSIPESRFDELIRFLTSGGNTNQSSEFYPL